MSHIDRESLENAASRTPSLTERDDLEINKALEPPSILDQLQLFPLPVPPNVAPRPVTMEEKKRIDTLSELQFFLATAPTRWNAQETAPSTHLTKFQLPNGEHVSCVLWNGLYHITGTDIVRALSFRFEAFGRPVKATKKWEEGVFSDLRNLKPGQDACLEEPKSALLDFLFRNGCIRTQKKQKVFYWFSVPHDRLFLDALERDLKREKVGQVPCTEVAGEPARSFRYDPRRSLYEQFAGQNPGLNNSALTPGPDYLHGNPDIARQSPALDITNGYAYPPHPHLPQPGPLIDPAMIGSYGPSPVNPPSMTFQRTLFEGSPAYKRRRVRSRQGTSPSVVDHDPYYRRDSPGQRSYTSDVRGGTMSPRFQHPQLRKVSGENYRESSPLGLKRERDSSSGPEGGDGNEKVYVCALPTCGRAFKRLEHLKRHVRTHTRERPYECSKCQKTFSRQDNLVAHYRSHEKVAEAGGSNSIGPIGTPPPKEGVDYYIAQPGGNMPPYRWATASPAGDGFHLVHNQSMPQPMRAMGSMPPPSLPYASRHSTIPPDWQAHAPHTASPQIDPQFQQEQTPAIRRFRSATPSSLAPMPIPVSAPPAPWGFAPPPPPPPYSGYGYWRNPGETTFHAYAPQHMGPPVSASPILGYDQASTPMAYGDSSATESYQTPNPE